MGICMYVGHMCAHVRDTSDHTQHTHISRYFDVFAKIPIVMWITQWICGWFEMHQCTHCVASCYVYDGTRSKSLCFPDHMIYSIQVHPFSDLSKNWYVQDDIIKWTLRTLLDNILVPCVCYYNGTIICSIHCASSVSSWVIKHEIVWNW